MALGKDSEAMGGIPVPGAYFRWTGLEIDWLQGAGKLVFTGYKDKATREANPLNTFGQVPLDFTGVARPEQAVEGVGPDGKPTRVVVRPATIAFASLADAPLSSFLAAPSGVATAQDLLGHMTLRDVLGAFAYAQAKADARLAGAVDA